jgi:hypothetical protein
MEKIGYGRYEIVLIVMLMAYVEVMRSESGRWLYACECGSTRDGSKGGVWSELDLYLTAL